MKKGLTNSQLVNISVGESLGFSFEPKTERQVMKIATLLLVFLTFVFTSGCATRASQTHEGQRWDAYADSPENYDGLVHHVVNQPVVYKEVLPDGSVLERVTRDYRVGKQGTIILPDGRMINPNTGFAEPMQKSN